MTTLRDPRMWLLKLAAAAKSFYRELRDDKTSRYQDFR